MPTSRLHRATLGLLLSAIAAVAATSAADSDAPVEGAMSRADALALVAALTDVGRQMFSDPSLSGSGQVACASCHDPQRAFGPSNGNSVQLAGNDLRQPGLRAVPSIKYLQAVPAFSEHFYEDEDEGDESIDAGPTGGLTWDGRVDRGRDQARLPLLSPFEMANADAAAVSAAMAKAPYAGALKALYGNDLFADPGKAFDVGLQALEAYEQDPGTFYPYTSKYDAYLAGKATLTDQEMRGLRAFNDPEKGNCASCHISTAAANGKPPEFSDFGMIALGLPRNLEIPANADPSYHDMGLCGPQRTDFTERPDYCGLFRTPSLRNVATRTAFFHNGVYHTLHDAVQFYALRDSAPQKIFPVAADGTVEKFNDLPAAYQDNVNTDPPFGGKPGDPPALSDSEIDDIVAFLGTLTDGYMPGPVPAQTAATP
jgi:cytochrome c peroxidase